MKQLFYNALTSLVTGLSFTMGLLGVLLLVEAWNHGKVRTESAHDWVNRPAGIVITEHDRVPGTPTLTIRGVLANESERTWREVSIDASILAGQAQVNECDATVRGMLAPGERRAFQLECYGVSGSVDPDLVTYQLEVVHGRTLDPTFEL